MGLELVARSSYEYGVHNRNRLDEQDLGPPNLEEEQQEHYPLYVTTAEERRRWRLAEAIAARDFADFGPAGVWMVARSLYRGPFPSGGEEPVGSLDPPQHPRS